MIEKIFNYAPGLILTLSISILAYILGRIFPIIGGAVFGIVIGIAIKNS